MSTISPERFLKHLQDISIVLIDICEHENVFIKYGEALTEISLEPSTMDDGTDVESYIVIDNISIEKFPLIMSRIQNFLSGNVNLVCYDNKIEIHWRNTTSSDTEFTYEGNGDQDLGDEGVFPYVEIPFWLDDLIFNKIGGLYQPNPQKFSYNLRNTKDQNLTYLGTYFPRSYAESYLLFRSIFIAKGFQEHYRKVASLQIMDIGSGTAGEIVGLIHAFVSVFEYSPKLNILLVDGNLQALNLARSVIRDTCGILGVQVELTMENLEIHSSVELDNITSKITKNYDFILTSKFINELMMVSPALNKKLYYDFVRIFKEVLKPKGLICIIDITTQLNEEEYFPKILNAQINELERDDDQLKTLIPLSCNTYGKKCDGGCFFGRIISLSHSHNANELTKIACRVVGNSEFISPLLRSNEAVTYYSPWINFRHQSRQLFCIKGSNQNERLDAFKI